MMRWFVVLLLLINILFFALMQWGGKLGREDSNAQPLAALNADKIKLLAQPVAAQTEVPAVTPVPAAAVAVAVPAVPAVVPVSAPVAVASLHAAEKPKEKKNEEEKSKPVKNCMEWGEFSGTDLARAENALAQMKLGDKLGQRTVEYTHGYWVYIPPFKTHAGRVKKIQQLKELGIADYFVVQEKGRWMNAISLGVFKTEEAANHYLGELGKKGVKSAKVGERASKLKFTVFVLKQMDAAGTTQLTALQKDYAGSEVKSVACNP